MSRNKGTPVDMSLPPEARGRKRRQGRIVATPPAQMSHGSSPRGQAQRRRGEKWLATQERLRADAVVSADELAGLDEERFAACTRERTAGDEAVRERGNVVAISRQASQELHDDRARAQRWQARDTAAGA